VIVTVVFAVTEEVLTVKVVLDAPAAMVTLAGTVATAVLLLLSDTTAPPAGAAEVKVRVPVEGLPPVTLVGLSDSAFSEAGGGAGVAVRTALRVVPL